MSLQLHLSRTGCAMQAMIQDMLTNNDPLILSESQSQQPAYLCWIGASTGLAALERMPNLQSLSLTGLPAYSHPIPH